MDFFQSCDIQHLIYKKVYLKNAGRHHQCKHKKQHFVLLNQEQIWSCYTGMWVCSVPVFSKSDRNPFFLPHCCTNCIHLHIDILICIHIASQITTIKLIKYKTKYVILRVDFFNGFQVLFHLPFPIAFGLLKGFWAT